MIRFLKATAQTTSKELGFCSRSRLTVRRQRTSRDQLAVLARINAGRSKRHGIADSVPA